MKYGVIDKKQIHHEGDQRSRDAPGHGYPAYTETVMQFHSFETADDLKRWIKMQDKDERYTVIEYQELEIKTEIKIDFKRPGATRVS